jgi:hypothetical protein
MTYSENTDDGDRHQDEEDDGKTKRNNTFTQHLTLTVVNLVAAGWKCVPSKVLAERAYMCPVTTTLVEEVENYFGHVKRRIEEDFPELFPVPVIKEIYAAFGLPLKSGEALDLNPLHAITPDRLKTVLPFYAHLNRSANALYFADHDNDPIYRESLRLEKNGLEGRGRRNLKRIDRFFSEGDRQQFLPRFDDEMEF